MSRHPIYNDHQTVVSHKSTTIIKNTSLLLTFIALFIASISSFTSDYLEASSIDDYVFEYDSTYSYSVEKTKKHDTYTLYTLSMKSQRWRKTPEVDKPVWSHTLYMIVPHTVKASGSLLVVQGGSHDDKKGKDSSENPGRHHIETAVETHSIVSVLTDVPNQPLRFIDEQDNRYVDNGRKEDALIAYSWDKSMKTGDPRWSIRLPMVKAIVKAMDTIQDFSSKYLDTHPFVKRFILTGKSKRGWAAWIAASIDSRVEGIVPVSIPLEDISEGFKRHKRAYKQWSAAIKDYIDLGIHEKLDSRPFKQLMELESPFFSMERIMIPKFIIEASGDEFFLPDASNYYSDALFGETHFLTVPNTGHNLPDNLYWPALSYYYSTLLYQNPLPQIQWVKQGTTLSIELNETPHAVTIWNAYNDSGRDFRHKVLQKGWERIPVEFEKGDKTFKFSFKTPEKGWAASFVEILFKENGKVWKCTSPVIIHPDTYPDDLSNE